MAREIPAGTKRLDLHKLLDAEKVFNEIKQARQSTRSVQISRQVDGSVSVTALAPASQTSTTESQLASNTKTGTSSNSTTTTKSEQGSDGTSTSDQNVVYAGNEASDEATSGASEKVSTESKRADMAEPPAGVLAPSATDASGLSAPYHQLLYATADTILGGQALQELYNVSALPKGAKLVTIPISASFRPGRVTRQNYSFEATVDLTSIDKCGVSGLKVLAIAPAGFSNFMNDSSSLYEGYGFSTGASIPVKLLTVEGKLSTKLEELRKFAEVARRPEFQVTIESDERFSVRYLGTGFQGEKGKLETRLVAASFNAEALALVFEGKQPARNADLCQAGLKSIDAWQFKAQEKEDESKKDESNESPTGNSLLDGAEGTKKFLESTVAADQAVIPYVVEWSAQPTLPLRGGRPAGWGWFPGRFKLYWYPQNYGERQIGSTYLAETHPPLTIDNVTRLGEKELLVHLKTFDPTQSARFDLRKGGGTVALTKSCFNLADAKKGATVLLQSSDAVWPSAGSSDAVQLLSTQDPADCASSQVPVPSWQILTLKKMEPSPPDKPELRLTSISALIQSKKLVAKLVLNQKVTASNLTVAINGQPATAAVAASKDGESLVYATINEDSSAEHNPTRQVDVHVSWEKDETTTLRASANATATW